MANNDFVLPDLGEGLTEATVVRWLVSVGDTVAIDQVVAEVETAKATVELPAPFGGTVVALHAEPGEEVEVGAPVVTFAGEESSADDEPAPDVADVSATDPDGGDAADRDANGHGADDDGSRLLVGYGTGGVARRRRRVAPHNGPDGAGGSGSRHGSAPTPQRPRPRAKPPVRKMAKDLGVDLAAVRGRGPDGRITRDDVRAAAIPDAKRRGDLTAALADVTDRRVPVTGVRARIAEHMAVAWREIPAASCTVDCDATQLLAVRQALIAAHPEARITPLILLLRATVVALRAHPELNATFDADNDEIVQHGAVHLGVATQTDRGLVVPVVRDAGRQSVLALADAVAGVTDAARAGTLAPAQMVGGTFTVSNFGGFGVDGGTPIVNHPQAAILGIGRIAERPWVFDGVVVVRQVVRLSVTFDHRACDGAEAAGFLRHMADLVEQPTLLLAH